MIESETRTMVDYSSDLWNNARQMVVENSVVPEKAEGVLANATLKGIDPSGIILSFDGEFAKASADGYRPMIESALRELTQTDMVVITEVSTSKDPNTAEPEVAFETSSTPDEYLSRPTYPKPPIAADITTPQPKQNNNQHKHGPSNKALTFDTFVVGDSNRMAFNAAKAVAEEPMKSSWFNPLFLYGNSGMGKTHLLLATKNLIEELYPELTVVYSSGRELFSDVSAGISAGYSSQGVLQKYRDADVVLIDDIQFLEGKKESMELVFEILNSEVVDKEKQLVFSSDRAPKDIDMHERYISRFSAGALIYIEPPTSETKFAILKKYCSKLPYPFESPSDEVLNYVVNISTSSIRLLQSAVHKITNYAYMQGSPITPEQAAEILKDHFPDKKMKKISISGIQEEVEKFYNVSHDELVGKKRDKGISTPRQVAMYLSRQLTEISYPQIGKNFNRDHTTVINGVRRIEDQMNASSSNFNSTLYEEIQKIEEKIKED